VILSSYTSNVEGQAAGTGGFAAAYVEPDTDGFPWIDKILRESPPWTLMTDTLTGGVVPTSGTLPGHLTVKFTTLASLNQNGLADFKIYDVYAHVTYNDSTTADIHPSSVVTHIGADGGILHNAANAIDGDTTTYAELIRSISGSLLSDVTYFTVTW
jgi:hypothetical protein